MATICLQSAPISRPVSITTCESFHPYSTRAELFYTLIYLKKSHCHVTFPGFGHLFIHHQTSPIPNCKYYLPWEARCCFLWYLQASNNTPVPLLPIPTPFYNTWVGHFNQWQKAFPLRLVEISDLSEKTITFLLETEQPFQLPAAMSWTQFSSAMPRLGVI